MAKEKNTVYETFKFFKSVYTQFNVASNIYFISEEGQHHSIKILFEKDSPFYYLFGTVSTNQYAENEFFQWLLESERCIKMPIEEFVELGKVLKKNAISLTHTETEFTFKFIDKATELEKTFSYSTIDLPEKNLNQIKKFESLLVEELKLEPENFDGEIFEIFENNGEFLINKRDGEKIIEVPSAKIISILKNSKPFTEFSNKFDGGKRIVELCSTNEDGITLKQLFLTI